MIHPSTELRFINDKIGYGVVATQFIPKGTITWVLDKLDREFTPGQLASLDPLYKDILDKYTYRNNQGNYVLCWDNARLVNHSFNSSCITTAYDFEIAVRDIYPGEELTDDYGYLNIDEPFEAEPEAGCDRTMVYPDDLLRFHSLWDAKLESAMPSINHLDQPLISLLDVDKWQQMIEIATGRRKMDSILTCYFDAARLKRTPDFHR